MAESDRLPPPSPVSLCFHMECSARSVPHPVRESTHITPNPASHPLALPSPMFQCGTLDVLAQVASRVHPAPVLDAHSPDTCNDAASPRPRKVARLEEPAGHAAHRPPHSPNCGARIFLHAYSYLQGKSAREFLDIVTKRNVPGDRPFLMAPYHTSAKYVLRKWAVAMLRECITILETGGPKRLYIIPKLRKPRLGFTRKAAAMTYLATTLCQQHTVNPVVENTLTVPLSYLILHGVYSMDPGVFRVLL